MILIEILLGLRLCGLVRILLHRDRTPYDRGITLTVLGTYILAMYLGSAYL